MPTLNLACTKAEWWEYSASWNNVAIGAGPIRVGFLPQISPVPVGMDLFSFEALPQNITITSAIAHFKAFDGISAGSATVKSRVSGTYRAWNSSAPDNLLTNTFNAQTSMFEYTIDVTSQINSYVAQGSSPYLYKFFPTDGRFMYDYLTSGNAPYIELTYTYNYTACGAPTSVSMSAAVAETDPTLSWAGSTPGNINSIIGYEILYAESADGSSWGAWTALKTVSTSGTSGSTSVTISPTRGYYRKYLIRTLGSAGSAYYSAWVESASVRRNSAPSAPSSISATPSLYESGGVTITWAGASDADSNIAAYELQRAISLDIANSVWIDWADINANITGSVATDTPNVARGQYAGYRVRAKDIFGVTGIYTDPVYIQKNQTPFAPAINHPVAGKTTYNPRPRVLVTVAFEPDSQLQTITASGYAVSGAGLHAQGKQLILQRVTSANAGEVQAVVVPTDTQGAAGASTTRTTTYTEPVWTDPLHAGGTRVRAAHINEIRAAVNVMRDYYGMSAYSWASVITARTTSLSDWAGHVAEIRTAIEQVAAYVNAWDSTATTGRITLPAWVAIKSKKPQADVMSQLRTVVTTL